MKYDFETVVNRSKLGSSKWSKMTAINPNVGPDIVPFSTADMEFKNAPEIIEGLKKYVDEMVFGYTGPTDAYYESVINWMTRHHGFTPKKEWIVTTPGVVPAIKDLIMALSKPGDGVLITPPVYHPFRMSIVSAGRDPVESPLIDCGGTYKIDFEDFEKKVSQPNVKLFVLCSPHNPVGRVWTKEELEKISEICLKHDVFVIDDEIHFDLIMPGYKHVSIATLKPEYFNNCALCTAPSKTFNIAGLQVSNIFIPNDDRRKIFTDYIGMSRLNAIAYKACELAYNNCEEWLSEVIKVIDANRQYVEDFMAEKLPEIKVYRLEGTYLLWFDCRALGLDKDALETFMQQEAQLFMDEGYIFGTGGEGFERIVLACPKKVIADAMDRLYNAVQRLKASRK